jgi:hypothetical protein
MLLYLREVNMRKMHRFSLVTVAAGALLVACSSTGTMVNTIQGTWFAGFIGTGDQYVFNSDGTYEYDYKFTGLMLEWEKGTYTDSGTQIGFTPTTQSASDTATLKDYTATYTLTAKTLDLQGTTGPGIGKLYDAR